MVYHGWTTGHETLRRICVILRSGAHRFCSATSFLGGALHCSTTAVTCDDPTGLPRPSAGGKDGNTGDMLLSIPTERRFYPPRAWGFNHDETSGIYSRASEHWVRISEGSILSHRHGDPHHAGLQRDEGDPRQMFFGGRYAKAVQGDPGEPCPEGEPRSMTRSADKTFSPSEVNRMCASWRRTYNDTGRDGGPRRGN
jgi:hypothetical protein